MYTWVTLKKNGVGRFKTRLSPPRDSNHTHFWTHQVPQKVPGARRGCSFYKTPAYSTTPILPAHGLGRSSGRYPFAPSLGRLRGLSFARGQLHGARRKDTQGATMPILHLSAESHHPKTNKHHVTARDISGRSDSLVLRWHTTWAGRTRDLTAHNSWTAARPLRLWGRSQLLSPFPRARKLSCHLSEAQDRGESREGAVMHVSM